MIRSLATETLLRFTNFQNTKRYSSNNRSSDKIIMIIIRIVQKYEGRKKKDPWWKRRIKEDMKQLKQDISILKRVKKKQTGARKEGMARLNWLRKSTE